MSKKPTKTETKKAKPKQAKPQEVKCAVHNMPQMAEPVVAPMHGDMDGEFLRAVGMVLENDKQAALKDLIKDMHAVELADLLKLLNSYEREKFVKLLGNDFDPDILTELGSPVREELVAYMPSRVLVNMVRDLESDDAVDLLDDLKQEEQREILEQIPEVDRAILQRSLDYSEDSAGRLMRSDLVAVPPFWNVGQVLDYLRSSSDLPEDFLEIFIVDPSFKPLGVVALNKIVRADRSLQIGEVMEESITLLPVDMDREEVARRFERYNLVSVGVVDAERHLLGVITADDVFEVISDEAEEDIRLLGGVGDETVEDSVLRATRGRFSWLLVNLGTALLASMVIAAFGESIEKMVALAVLMPIVASMGGNAGTQTLTIAVRALATHELISANVLRVIFRELMIGILNGLLFAVIMGGLAGIWFDSWVLGGVLGMAMIVNLFVAALSGILIPFGLYRLGIDPALASSVFVTTVTDVIGFFAFLGFATIVLL